jgi:hypothetical protein
MQTAKKACVEVLKKKRNENKKPKSPSLPDIVRQLKSENLQLTRDLLDLTKENYALKEKAIIKKVPGECLY